MYPIPLPGSADSFGRDFRHAAHLYGKKVALAGDPDQLIPLVEFLVTIGMKPVHIVTGTPGKAFTKRIKEITAKFGDDINVKTPAICSCCISGLRMNQLICSSATPTASTWPGTRISPLCATASPSWTRIGHSYFPTVGYKGGLHLLEKILGVLMDRKDRDSSEEAFELVE